MANRVSEWFCAEYPSLLKVGLQEYRGWTKDILNLNHEEDIFKLITLAINWNTNISWEIGLATFELLNEEGFLYANELRDLQNAEGVKQRIESESFKDVLSLRIRTIQKRPYAKPREINGGPRRSWVDAYHVAAINWDRIRGWMKIDEIELGHTPEIDGNKLIENLENLFRINADGKFRIMLKVKAYLICRELNCQNAAVIKSKYCCVPDFRVREAMKNLGFPVSYDYFENSAIIARYFGLLYDLPLFYFFDECKQHKGSSCRKCTVEELCPSAELR